MVNDTVTLRDHLDALRKVQERADDRFDRERDRRYSERAESDQKALVVAMGSVGEALKINALTTREDKAGANEWRGALNDTVARMPSKQELDAEFRRVNGRLDELKAGADVNKGSGAGRGQMWGYVAGGIGLLISMAMFFVTIVTIAIAVYSFISKGGAP